MEPALETLPAYPALNLPFDVIIKFGLAVILAGAVGVERQRKGRPAGVRTHILVCLGSTLLMIVSDYIAAEWASQGAPIWLDRGRIAAGIVTGVGFLGAGTIINFGREQHGLTTAAMIWFAAALGISIGAGYYLVSVTATGFALAVVIGLGALEGIVPSRDYYTLTMQFDPEEHDLNGIQEALCAQNGFAITHSRTRFGQSMEYAELTFRVEALSRTQYSEMLSHLRREYADMRYIDLRR